MDRLVVKEGIESRLAEAVELAISHGDGLVNILAGEEIESIQHQACLP